MHQPNERTTSLTGTFMFDPKSLDDMARKFSALIPAPLGQAQEELEKNFKAGLQGLLSKMDLVTREEYDVQVQLLEHSRERLAAMEQRLNALENTAKPD
ncbi:unnamed protein product [Cyprideis torosa]|uniref:Uncharacterized protein n=1 Tax=Cyprideis torosa TaxID=163714 RepID=A0A7R8X1S6_9CRUS|nr:unnamed protein product [Cyprideis torosa]CAG0910518.1 unnamed protein product [Cyprideis torosa]